MNRLGGACLALGSLLFGGFRVLHGDLPADDARAALAFIHDRPIYETVHLGAVLGALFLVAGIVTLTSTFTNALASTLGRLATASTLIGAAIFITDFTIDGVTGHDLAEDWAAAPPTEQADLVQSAHTAFALLRGTSLTSLIILLGLPLLLLGPALLDEHYPAWLPWAGMTVGAAITTAATLLLFNPDLFDGVILYGLLASIAAPVWTLVLGINMWRHDRPATTTPGSKALG